jgi:hypothetical protein
MLLLCLVPMLVPVKGATDAAHGAADIVLTERLSLVFLPSSIFPTHFVGPSIPFNVMKKALHRKSFDGLVFVD